MSRQSRKKSPTGFYHVMVRGIGKQLLFEDEQDYFRFLDTMKRYQEEHDIQLHAYCLMDNHVHMLVRDMVDELHIFMKKLEGSYAFYFNHKYERVGALFQERYKSEIVDNETYYKVALRYILQNPQKADICSMEEYPWNSYAEYQRVFKGDGKTGINARCAVPLIDTDFALTVFGGKGALMKYLHDENSDVCAEPAAPPISDRKAQQIIHECLKLDSGTQLQSLKKSDRDRALGILKENGLSVRQIERMTGINRGAILRA